MSTANDGPPPELSEDDITGIVERDVPGFTAAHAQAGDAMAKPLPKVDAIAPYLRPQSADFAAEQVAEPTISDILPVRIVPKTPAAADAVSPFAEGRTVLINRRSRRVEGAQG